MKSVVTATLASLLMISAAFAASPEDDYLAARKAHFAAIAAAEKAAKSEAEIQKLDDAARADLQKRLLAALGASSFPGVPPTPIYRPETLLGGQLESGAADGLRYASEDQGRAYLVTTEKILLAWAGDQAVDTPTMAKALRSGVPGLFALNDVYTHTVGVDAAFEPFLDLPVDAGAGAVGRAMIGAFAQDTPMAPPNALVVAVASGGRVVFATVPAKTAVADPKTCVTLKKKFDEHYIGCVAKALKQSPQFAALTREAQDLLVSVRGK